MILLEPGQSPYDLNFRVGDVPVRVHPYFWLTAVILGIDTQLQGIDIFTHMLVWVAVLFAAILVHELGHIVAGRKFGNQGYIVLTGFCGLAVGSANCSERWQRNVVSFAGPLAGFLLAFVVFVVMLLVNAEYAVWLALHKFISLRHPAHDLPDLVAFGLNNLMFICIFWGLVNLLPIWPLDGGHISQEWFEKYRGREGLRAALITSLAVSAGLAGLALLEVLMKGPLLPFPSFGQTLFPTLFFAYFAVNSWYVLQQVPRGGGGRGFERDESHEPRAPWEQDADWWKKG